MTLLKGNILNAFSLKDKTHAMLALFLGVRLLTQFIAPTT
jgi:hypothetical protein